MSTVVVKAIAIPPRAKLAKAGISLVKAASLWWITPVGKPDFRVGDGFKTKAEAQKEALACLRVAEDSK